MTEEEAKTMTCPHTIERVTLLHRLFSIRGLQSGKCCAGACMAWRPTTSSRRETINSTQNPGPGWHISAGTSDGWFRYVEEPAGGFCGFAGAPQ